MLSLTRQNASIDAADDAKAQDMDGYMDTPVDNYPDAPEISEPEYNDFEMDIADVYKTFGDAVDVPDNDLSNDRTNTDIDTGTDTDTGTDSFADTDSDNSYVDAAEPSHHLLIIRLLNGKCGLINKNIQRKEKAYKAGTEICML